MNSMRNKIKAIGKCLFSRYPLMRLLLAQHQRWLSDSCTCPLATGAVHILWPLEQVTSSGTVTCNTNAMTKHNERGKHHVWCWPLPSPPCQPFHVMLVSVDIVVSAKQEVECSNKLNTFLGQHACTRKWYQERHSALSHPHTIFTLTQSLPLTPAQPVLRRSVLLLCADEEGRSGWD